MKKLFIAAVLILSIVTLNSCSKNNSGNNRLIGNWNVVNDSSVNTNEFFTLYRGDSGIISGNYNGVQCGATFSFSSNGNLATSFYDCQFGLAPIIDSAKYIITNNQLTISIYAEGDCCESVDLNPKISRTYIISNLAANAATLTYSQVINSSSQKQSIATEIINLKK